MIAREFHPLVCVVVEWISQSFAPEEARMVERSAASALRLNQQAGMRWQGRGKTPLPHRDRLIGPEISPQKAAAPRVPNGKHGKLIYKNDEAHRNSGRTSARVDQIGIGAIVRQVAQGSRPHAVGEPQPAEISESFPASLLNTTQLDKTALRRHVYPIRV